VFVSGMAAVAIVGQPFADVASMARLHGSFAAIGLVFGGLLGWRLADRPRPSGEGRFGRSLDRDARKAADERVADVE
jgi:hypothetical protein